MQSGTIKAHLQTGSGGFVADIEVGAWSAPQVIVYEGAVYLLALSQDYRGAKDLEISATYRQAYAHFARDPGPVKLRARVVQS